MTHVFQTDLPAAEAKLIVSAILSKQALTPAVARAGWVVAEYGLVLAVGDGVAPLPPPVKSAATMSEEDSLYLLLALANQAPAADTHLVAGIAVTWGIIVSVILKYLITYLV